jgi:hypothetical protein
MANDGKFLNITSGVPQQEVAVNTSAGAGDAGKIAKLDSTGRWDLSMMPTGVTAEVATITTSEALAAGDFVNIWNSTGIKARKADATTAGKKADGFVLAAVLSGASATVYLPGSINTAVSGLTAGADQFLNTTAGGRTETAPSASGNVAQLLGKALSSTSMYFHPLHSITMA